MFTFQLLPSSNIVDHTMVEWLFIRHNISEEDDDGGHVIFYELIPSQSPNDNTPKEEEEEDNKPLNMEVAMNKCM